MISTAPRYVWVVCGAMLAYGLAVAAGLVAGLIRLEAAPLCIALLCFATCLWYTNAYLEVRATPFGWGHLANAGGWGAVSLAFLVPKGLHLPFSLVAAALIAAGGVATWLSVRARSPDEAGPGESRTP